MISPKNLSSKRKPHASGTSDRLGRSLESLVVTSLSNILLQGKAGMTTKCLTSLLVI